MTPSDVVDSVTGGMDGGTRTDGDGEEANRSRLADRTALGLLIVFGLLLAGFVVRSLGWRTEHDVPLAHYSAFMHARYGTRPYQQLFEISFPGTILLHLGVTAIFGYGDRGVMAANLLWFLLLSMVTARLLRPFGRLVAAGGVIVFGVAYFSYGQQMMLQRDCVLILPVATALLLHARGGLRPVARRAVVGLLVGLAAAIKPHAAVALVPLLVDELWPLWRDREPPRATGARVGDTVRIVANYAVGAAIPCGLVFAWLVATGGFGGWLEMSRQYLPLYLHMTGAHETIAGFPRLLYLLKGFLSFGAQPAWFVAAGIGVFAMIVRGDARSPQSRLMRLLLGEAAAFAVYPTLAGQFWQYHYIPFIYFVTLLASLALRPVEHPRSLGHALFPTLALALALLGNVQLIEAASGLVRQGKGPDQKLREVDQMAAYLQDHLQPGDTVQPLDWTGGVVHAMLIARARLATRFMYDYHFYHHVSQPYIATLRRRFVDEMAAARPRFVVEYFGENKPWPVGKDTTRDFPALRALLDAQYRVVLAAPNFRIYDRQAAPG